eukprot:TRINITY_DN29673_c3_g1_i1.p1 TRINITY_DN29673_c3_g1~~TRINITY_DN29673_c3_g1_i1.p1  ORF type:complete len:281 (+),score=19.16 TRINITY_DN29673_c3_g1_i1:69-845(+)
METYELTQEDYTLERAYCLNARIAGRRPHHFSSHKAQQRAACLAAHVAKYEPISPRSSSSRASQDDSSSFGFESAPCSDDETTSDYRSSLGSYCDGVPCRGSNDQCSSSKHDRSRDAMVNGHERNNSTRFWRRYRRARTHVIPENDPLSTQSHGGSRPQEQVRPTSCHCKTVNSCTRRRETEDHATRFHSLMFIECPGAYGHSDDIDYETSDDFDDVKALSSERSQASLTSLKSFVEKRMSRIRTVIKMARVSFSPKA